MPKLNLLVTIFVVLLSVSGAKKADAFVELKQPVFEVGTGDFIDPYMQNAREVAGPYTDDGILRVNDKAAEAAIEFILKEADRGIAQLRTVLGTEKNLTDSQKKWLMFRMQDLMLLRPFLDTPMGRSWSHRYTLEKFSGFLSMYSEENTLKTDLAAIEAATSVPYYRIEHKYAGNYEFLYGGEKRTRVNRINNIAKLKDGRPNIKWTEPTLPYALSGSGCKKFQSVCDKWKSLPRELEEIDTSTNNISELALSQESIDKLLPNVESNFKDLLSPYNALSAKYNINELERTIYTTFKRNMVKKDLDNACKFNGSAQNCTETFEAAANVVAVLDPNKGGAAEWTGRKAKEVLDDLVKLGGTQEQLMDVVQFAISNVKFIEQSLPSNTRIDGPKEAAAVNLLKAVININNMKQAAKNKEDEANQTATNILLTLNTIKSMNVVSVNNKIITPTMNSMRLIGSVSQTYDTMSGLSTWNSIQINKIKLDSYLNNSLSNYQIEKARQSKQNDAPTTVQQVIPQVQVQQQQVVQQQQQQNCNPQWQDC